MTFVSISDYNQWKFILPNILVLEQFQKSYDYYIFGDNRYTVQQVRSLVDKLNIVYGKIHTSTIPSFFKVFDIPPTDTNHCWITPTTMDRFVIPIYTDIKKFVWLDCDTLITNVNIFDLENFETSAKGIAAVPTDVLLHDHIVYFSKASMLLDLAKLNSSTFNAGVCLIDCEKLNSNNYYDFIKDIFERSEGAYINDEVILNLYDQDYNELPIHYNCMTHKPIEVINPSVVHFSGKDYKPWVNYVYKQGYYLKHYKLWEYYYLTLADYASRHEYSTLKVK
jgi:lipopolysaccharide biosynthesis glycosyltransferase